MAMASWNLSLSPRPKLVQVSCRKREKNRDNYDPYKVIEITPPPKNLGVRCFPSEWHIRLFRWVGVGDDFGKCPEEEALYSCWRRLNPNASHFTHLCAVEKGKNLTEANLHCGDSVTIEGQTYTISAVTHRYQLRKGKYEPSEKRLDVLSTARYILNLYLDNLLEQS